MKLFFATIILLCACVISGNTQSRKEKKKEAEKQVKAEERMDNSYSPYSKAETPYTSEQVRQSKKSRKNKSFTQRYRESLDQKIVEFEKRMKQNARDDRKEARIMKKPQYSDPMYFGHKRKPKKRKLHKRKLCKECGIVH